MDLSKWLASALAHSGMSQAELARQMSEHLGRSIDRAAVNKMLRLVQRPSGGKPRRLSADEMVAVEKITGYAAPAGARRKLIDSFDPYAPDPVIDPDAQSAESSVDGGIRTPDLPSGAILEADLKIGLGSGQMSVPGLELLHHSGATYAAEGIRDWWRFPEHFIRGRFRVPVSRIRCFQADGDSMWPTIADGDMVFVDIGHRLVSPDGVYALSDMYGGVSCKRLTLLPPTDGQPARIRVSSDNAGHETYERDPEQVVIAGRYLGRLTTR